MIRAAMSVGPPGGITTTISIGRLGYFFSEARPRSGSENRRPPKASMIPTILVFIFSPVCKGEGFDSVLLRAMDGETESP